MTKLSSMSQKQKKDLLFRSLKIILGTIILALGQTIFIEQCVLVTGGLASIGNIVNQFIPSKYTVSITVVILTIISFLLGYIFLSKKFIAQTILSMVVYAIAYPIFSALLNNGFLNFLTIPPDPSTGVFSETTMLLAGVFGGITSGAGIGICMLGGGSTGGMDVLAILMAKITKTKVSLWIFILDALVVFLGYILVNRSIVYFLVCSLSALCCSISLDFLFSKRNDSYVVNIISKEWESINNFIINDLDRGSTIIDVQGGYKFDNYRMIQAAISRDQYSTLLSKISEIDNSAFVTVNSAHDINGEGFQTLPKTIKKKEQQKNGRSRKE